MPAGPPPAIQQPTEILSSIFFKFQRIVRERFSAMRASDHDARFTFQMHVLIRKSLVLGSASAIVEETKGEARLRSKPAVTYCFPIKGSQPISLFYQQCRCEFAPFSKWKRLRVRRKHLHADMAGARGLMRANPIGDGSKITPGNDRVNQPVAAALD